MLWDECSWAMRKGMPDGIPGNESSLSQNYAKSWDTPTSITRFSHSLIIYAQLGGAGLRPANKHVNSRIYICQARHIPQAGGLPQRAKSLARVYTEVLHFYLQPSAIAQKHLILNAFILKGRNATPFSPCRTAPTHHAEHIYPPPIVFTSLVGHVCPPPLVFTPIWPLPPWWLKGESRSAKLRCIRARPTTWSRITISSAFTVHKRTGHGRTPCLPCRFCPYNFLSVCHIFRFNTFYVQNAPLASQNTHKFAKMPMGGVILRRIILWFQDFFTFLRVKEKFFGMVTIHRSHEFFTFSHEKRLNDADFCKAQTIELRFHKD